MLKVIILSEKTISEQLEVGNGGVKEFGVGDGEKFTRKSRKSNGQKLFKSRKWKGKKLS